MAEGVWMPAKLKPEQEQLLKEAEGSLGGGVLVAFSDGACTPTELTPSQLECLRGLEHQLGLVVIAVRPT